MSCQEALTFLFDAIALSFVAIAAIDLSREIITLYKQTFVALQPTLLTSQLQALPQLPDPWLLPAPEALDSPKLTQVQPKPVLLLVEAKTVDERRLPSTQSTIKELLTGVDVDTLKLRQARKIAKALGIAQKVNGKDQTLAFLRSQIKLKLQQSLHPEVACDLREKLIAC